MFRCLRLWYEIEIEIEIRIERPSVVPGAFAFRTRPWNDAFGRSECMDSLRCPAAREDGRVKHEPWEISVACLVI